jgi:hypothetical protein
LQKLPQRFSLRLSLLPQRLHFVTTGFLQSTDTVYLSWSQIEPLLHPLDESLSVLSSKPASRLVV